MNKVVSIGLFVLLLYHTLAYVLVGIGAWWQAEHDLSERLLVYRTVDSLIEFVIPVSDQFNKDALPDVTAEGFTYRGSYYAVVSIETRDNSLYITGMEQKSHSFWQKDLLSFLNSHIAGAAESPRKANQFLKFLLKEYPPIQRVVFSFRPPNWRDTVRIADQLFVVTARALPIHSPPPEV